VLTTGREVAEIVRTLASAYMLHPCDSTYILVFQRTEGQRYAGLMKGWSCQKAEATEEE